MAGAPLPAAQRVAGRARLFCGKSDGRTRLQRLYQDGSAKIRLPAVQGDPLEAVLINTAGGMTGGDRLGWTIEVGAEASASITTQACEIDIQRAGEGGAVENDGFLRQPGEAPAR
ncbi:MAG: hypothetical protein E5W35_18880, partial [Mesorhizobium sp.]